MLSRIFPYLWLAWKPSLGASYLGHRRALARQERLSREEMDRLQWKRIEASLRHAYDHVPFYKKRFDEAGLRPALIRTRQDFLRIPILTRHDVQRDREDLVARDSDRAKLRRNATGGSTGAPTMFYEDLHSMAHGKAVKERARGWAGIREGDSRAIIWGADRDIRTRSLADRLRVRFIRREAWLNSYRLTPERMEEFAHLLVRWQPRSIVAYVSSLYVFASFLRERGLDRIRPHAIETSAEKLWNDERALIEDVFKCKVFDYYGSRELHGMASECEEHRGLHVFSDAVCLEVLRDGLPAGPGEVGEIVVTALANRAMPLIRYRNGDLGVATDRLCPCGRPFPLLESIVGRSNDLVSTPRGEYVHGAYFNHLLFKMAGLEQFQVHQKSLTEVTVSLQAKNGLPSATLEDLRERIAQHLGAGVHVELRVVASLPPTAAGKHRYIISEVTPRFIAPSS